MNTPHTHVWCEVCQTIRPIKLDDMHADDATGHYTEARDLMCTVCGLVIATLYLPKPKTKAIEALHAAKGAALNSWQPTPTHCPSPYVAMCIISRRLATRLDWCARTRY